MGREAAVAVAAAAVAAAAVAARVAGAARALRAKRRRRLASKAAFVFSCGLFGCGGYRFGLGSGYNPSHNAGTTLWTNREIHNTSILDAI